MGRCEDRPEFIRAEQEMTEEEFLAAYRKRTYPKPALTADAVVFRRAENTGVEVLLVKRGRHPCRGQWALPGGFVDEGEDADHACERELEEETGVVGVPFEQLGLYSTPGRDPRGWTVSSAYVACLSDERAACAGDDAAEARWFAVREESRADGASMLALAGGGVELSVTFRRAAQPFSAPRAQVESSQGLAFDHGRIVADAWLRMRGR